MRSGEAAVPQVRAMTCGIAGINISLEIFKKNVKNTQKKENP